jgi:hypothetical protein
MVSWSVIYDVLPEEEKSKVQFKDGFAWYAGQK